MVRVAVYVPLWAVMGISSLRRASAMAVPRPPVLTAPVPLNGAAEMSVRLLLRPEATSSVRGDGRTGGGELVVGVPERVGERTSVLGVLRGPAQLGAGEGLAATGGEVAHLADDVPARIAVTGVDDGHLVETTISGEELAGTGTAADELGAAQVDAAVSRVGRVGRSIRVGGVRVLGRCGSPGRQGRRRSSGRTTGGRGRPPSSCSPRQRREDRRGSRAEQSPQASEP